MFRVLLESRALRQRRAGGVALSVAAHLAIVGAAGAATAEHFERPTLSKPIQVVVVPPAPSPPVKPAIVISSGERMSGSFTLPQTLDIPHIDAPTTVPNVLPSIDVGYVEPVEVAIGGPPRGGAVGPERFGLVGNQPESTSNEWSGNELLMRVVVSSKPRYPEALRQSGIDGRVFVRFTIDTLGRIDPASVEVLQTTHELFTRSVRDALTAFRFRPAETGGRRVAALAEMPFEFTIRR